MKYMVKKYYVFCFMTIRSRSKIFTRYGIMYCYSLHKCAYKPVNCVFVCMYNNNPTFDVLCAPWVTNPSQVLSMFSYMLWHLTGTIAILIRYANGTKKAVKGEIWYVHVLNHIPIIIPFSYNYYIYTHPHNLFKYPMLIVRRCVCMVKSVIDNLYLE